MKTVTKAPPFWKFWSHAKTTQTTRVRLTQKQKDALMWQARYNVVSRAVAELGPATGRAVDAGPEEICAQLRGGAGHAVHHPDRSGQRADREVPGELRRRPGGADLVLQSVREYPNGTTAAHLLGELRQDNRSLDGEEAFFNYRLPDYHGETGVEAKYNSELHGHAGGVSVKVNSLGYRQSEDVDTPPVPGQDVTLTVDLDLQRAAGRGAGERGRAAKVNGAVVVMDVRNGDVLAMASSPTFDPNDFAEGISTEKYAQLQDLQAEKNRATFENYAPGSIFKTVVALAALENGLNPEEILPRAGRSHAKSGPRAAFTSASARSTTPLRRGITISRKRSSIRAMPISSTRD